jgi:hypothetical protein
VSFIQNDLLSYPGFQEGATALGFQPLMEEDRVFELQTSGRGFLGPDLHLDKVWHDLSTSFSQAEILVPFSPGVLEQDVPAVRKG